jgi:hypothetical protein
MVESICGQGFAYSREVEERRQKLVKLELEKATYETADSTATLLSAFYRRPGGVRAKYGTFPIDQGKASVDLIDSCSIWIDPGGWSRVIHSRSLMASEALAGDAACQARGPGGSYPAGWTGPFGLASGPGGRGLSGARCGMARASGWASRPRRPPPAFSFFCFSFCILVVCLHGLLNWPINKTLYGLLFSPIYFQ